MKRVWISTQEYAKHRDISDRAVRKFISTGRIPGDAAKKQGRGFLIHRTKADTSLAGNLSHPARKRGQASEADKRKIIDAAGIPSCSSLTEAQRIDREFQAALRKLAYQEKCGELVSREQVEKEAFDIARRVRDALLSLPDRISAQLAAMSDRDSIHAILTKEIRHALMGLAK